MVRAALAERQRDFAAQEGGAVLDGRDIGTIIAPHADAKLFVTASPEVRARRRFEELNRMGLAVHYEDVLLDIRARDERDMRPRRRAAGQGGGRGAARHERDGRGRGDRGGDRGGGAAQ